MVNICRILCNYVDKTRRHGYKLMDPLPHPVCTQEGQLCAFLITVMYWYIFTMGSHKISWVGLYIGCGSQASPLLLFLSFMGVAIPLYYLKLQANFSLVISLIILITQCSCSFRVLCTVSLVGLLNFDIRFEGQKMRNFTKRIHTCP